jgi:hypothetical protein
MNYQPIQNGTKVVVHTMLESRPGIIIHSISMMYKIKLDNGRVGWYGRYEIDPDRSEIWRSARNA